MPRYFYFFSYVKSGQEKERPDSGFRDESSAAVFIEAGTAQEALEWGRQISAKFVAQTAGGEGTTWDPSAFANWIDADPQSQYPDHILSQIPTVSTGMYPDFCQLQR